MSEDAVGPGGIIGPGGGYDEQKGGDEVTLNAYMADEGEDVMTIMASAVPPKGKVRTPTDICCVIDVSGSMGAEATTQNASGQSETYGLSLLDVVKHAVRTVIATLGPNDRVSLVSYSTSATVCCELVSCNEAGKKQAEEALEMMHPTGQTNLWDGLLNGLEVLRKGRDQDNTNRLAAVLLLTDGQPNISPPRGHLPMLKKYKDQHQELSATISTFGFGYNLDSPLLRDLAKEGDGMYAFIPDSGFVGTAFVNALANLLTTMAKNTILQIEMEGGAEFGMVLGGYPVTRTSWGAQISLGPLAYGQTRDIVFKVRPKGAAKPCGVMLKYFTRNSSEAHEVVQDNLQPAGSRLKAPLLRSKLIDAITTATAFMCAQRADDAQHQISSLIEHAREGGLDDALCVGYGRDLSGQVTEALSREDWFNKWGKHYLPSLARAHQLQQCNNFKDPGVQEYGGELFASIQDVADDIFCSLPPPKPSIQPMMSGYSPYGGGGGAAPAAPVASMAAFNNASNPCFHGSCLVHMADGSRKEVRKVRKGDVVVVPSSNPAQKDSEATVECVVRTACAGGKTALATLAGGLLVTPYHPLRMDCGRWIFPQDLGTVETLPCDAVFSFVLSNGHVMCINGFSAVSMGHDFVNDKVVAHPYFGSPAVVCDLARMPGWQEGLIMLRPGCCVRDPVTGLVCGFNPESVVFDLDDCSSSSTLFNHTAQYI